MCMTDTRGNKSVCGVQVFDQDRPERMGRSGEKRHEMGSKLYDIVAYDFDGDRYCPDCVSAEYQDLCFNSASDIPAGGPVNRGTEVDYVATCGHCGITISDLAVIR